MITRLSIDKEEINLLPPMDFEGEIVEIVTPEGARRAVEVLCREKVLGFDTETRPSFSKGESYTPAILQLANDKQAFIFRLKFFAFPPEIVGLLEDESILKVGIGIKDDLVGLGKIVNFRPGGFLDLAEEVKKFGVSGAGLRSLTAIFLGKKLFKKAKTTNWERTDLTLAQIKYAATDAVVGYLIHEKIIAMGKR
jgi:ribonuclease D